MKENKFDQFAENYSTIFSQSVLLSEQALDFFSEYKIHDLAEIISANIKSQSHFNILDFGSGVGNSIPYFNKYLPKAILSCLDVSKESLAIAQKRFSDVASYLLFDGQIIPSPDDFFDLVFSACVFHHIDHQKHPQIFKEIFRVLKPNGLVVIFEHNPYNPVTAHVVRHCPFDINVVLVKPYQLIKNLKLSGFGSITRCYRIFFPPKLKILRPLERYIAWLPLGAQYYVVAKK